MRRVLIFLKRNIGIRFLNQNITMFKVVDNCAEMWYNDENGKMLNL